MKAWFILLDTSNISMELTPYWNKKLTIGSAEYNQPGHNLVPSAIREVPWTSEVTSLCVLLLSKSPIHLSLLCATCFYFYYYMKDRRQYLNLQLANRKLANSQLAYQSIPRDYQDRRVNLTYRFFQNIEKTIYPSRAETFSSCLFTFRESFDMSVTRLSFLTSV